MVSRQRCSYSHSRGANQVAMKGQDSQYRPPAGTTCLISGPNCDEHGYTYEEYTILWQDATFVLYGTPGCCPNLERWDHILYKPLEPMEPVLLKEHYALQALAGGLQTRTSNQMFARVSQMIEQLGGFPQLQTEAPRNPPQCLLQVYTHDFNSQPVARPGRS